MEIRCLSTLDAMAIAEKTKHGWLCTTNLLADENCSKSGEDEGSADDTGRREECVRLLGLSMTLTVAVHRQSFNERPSDSIRISSVC